MILLASANIQSIYPHDTASVMTGAKDKQMFWASTPPNGVQVHIRYPPGNHELDQTPSLNSSSLASMCETVILLQSQSCTDHRHEGRASD